MLFSLSASPLLNLHHSSIETGAEMFALLRSDWSRLECNACVGSASLTLLPFFISSLFPSLLVVSLRSHFCSSLLLHLSLSPSLPSFVLYGRFTIDDKDSVFISLSLNSDLRGFVARVFVDPYRRHGYQPFRSVCQLSCR